MSFKATLGLPHELNFCLALWGIYCDISNASHSVFMMKRKFILPQVFQVPKPHQYCFFSEGLELTFPFLFHKHRLLPAITVLRAHCIQITVPCATIPAALHNSLTKSLKMCIPFDPRTPFLKMHHSLTFLCYSFFHLFRWRVPRVLLDTGARQQ